MKPHALFHIQREGSEAGPYDLVQMAALLRQKIIDGQTPTRLNGEDTWMPFSWQPQFSVVREIPDDAESERIDELNEEATDKRSPIPLPSRETVLKVGVMVVVVLLAGLGAFCLAWLDTTTGICLIVAGMIAATYAHCMIMVRLLDEDFWTLSLVFFVPGGGIFYFISRFWQYAKWYCIRYFSTAIILGALIGLGQHFPGIFKH